MKRILFLAVGPFYFPQQIAIVDRFTLLSQRYRGEIFAVVNDASLRRVEVAQFTVTGLLLSATIRHSSLRRGVLFCGFAVATALYRHYFEHKYDAIVASDPLVAGPIALIIGWLTGAKAIVEVNGQYESSFRLDGAEVSRKQRLKENCAKRILQFVVRRASVVRLLYPDQLRNMPTGRPRGNCVSFPEFVPVSRFKSNGEDGRYILFVGYPWYLKGVDILVKSFNLICGDFPQHTLKVVGYCWDRSLFVGLAAGNPRIEFCDPVEYEGVIELMAHASVFVLPSRTEAMGRVILEAMASRKPVVASNVDGIPYVIRDGVTGLLFESGDADDLAAKLRQVLGSPELAGRLAEAAYRDVQINMAEPNYLTAFGRMVEDVT